MDVTERLGKRTRTRHHHLIRFLHKQLMEHGGPASTHTIYDWCKEANNRRLDVTMNALSNVLGKNPTIFKKCLDKQSIPHPLADARGTGMSSSQYRIAMWEAVP